MTEVAFLACSVEAGTEDVVDVTDIKGEVPFPVVETDARTKVAVEAGVSDWKGQWLTLGGHLEIVETSVTDTTASPDDVGVELPPAEIDIEMFIEEDVVEPPRIVVAFELDVGALEIAVSVLELDALLLDADELELREPLDIALLELETALGEETVMLDGTTLELDGVLSELESLIEELGTPADDAAEVDDVTAEGLAIDTEDTAWVVDTAAVVVATWVEDTAPVVCMVAEEVTGETVQAESSK